jgi:hypothetical protein
LLYAFDGWPLLWSVLVVASVFAFVGTAAGKASGLLRAGWAWSILLIVSACLKVFGAVSQEMLVAFLTIIYEQLQILAGAILLLAAIELIFKPRESGTTLTHRFTRLAFLYVPLIAISILGPLIVGGTLTLIEDARQKEWSRVFTEALSYSIGSAEVIMGVIVLAIGLLLAGPIGFFLYRGLPGKRTQDWLQKWLFITPIFLLANSVLFFLFAYKNAPFQIPVIVNWDAIPAYEASSLRVLGYLPLMAGGLAVILDILGDVAFYLLPGYHHLSVRTKVQSRLRTCIEGVTGQIGDLTIIAHSQGSAIAADVLEEIDRTSVRLLTVGSPIDSLYRRFLGVEVGTKLRTSLGQDRWLNRRREDDYVAGNITGVDNDLLTNPLNNGHLNYWEENLLGNIVTTQNANDSRSIEGELGETEFE